MGKDATGGQSRFRGAKSIGKLRQRIELQTATEVTAASGQITETWATTMTVWADVRPVSAYESYQAMMLQAEITHRIRIRYSSTLVTDYVKGLSKKRVKWGNRIFRIEGHRRVDEIGKWFDLTAVEEV